MDALFWGPDWSPAEDPEFFDRLEIALKAPDWVLDGNYTRSMPIKWAEVDIVIWLDYSFPRTVLQALKRAFSRIVTQEELWPGTGNRESLQKLLSSDSILLWTISTYGRRKKQIAGYTEDSAYSHIHFHHLRSPAKAKRFLKDVQQFPQRLTHIIKR
jgi:hypothetical protein